MQGAGSDNGFSRVIFFQYESCGIQVMKDPELVFGRNGRRQGNENQIDMPKLNPAFEKF